MEEEGRVVDEHLIGNVCEECGSPLTDEKYIETFKVFVCNSCKNQYPDLYSLVTKTGAMREFLLTSEELEDHGRLPYLSRPNPRKSSWHSMQLYLRKQLVSFAVEKYGSLDALEARRQDWTTSKLKRKEQKYRTKMQELRNKTRSDTWTKKDTPHLKPRHQHHFIQDGTGKTCKDCQYRVNFESVD